MEDPLVLISAVTKNLPNWTVKVTITEEMPALVGFQRGTLYKRFILTDDEGDTVTAIVYGRDIPLFTSTLHLHGVYRISNALVKDTVVQPDGRVYPKHWILQRGTIVTPLSEEPPNLRYFLDGLTPFGRVQDYVDKDDETVDIMGILIKSEPPRSVTTKTGQATIQSFTVVDTERIPMTLSLWEQLVEHCGPNLVAAAATYSVVVAKRLKAKSYNGGITLSSLTTSSFTIDPPIAPATALRSWFDSVREMELPNMLEYYSVARTKDLVDRNIIRKYSVREIQESEECTDFWTRSCLQLAEGEQRLHYIGCCNCYTKVNAQCGKTYPCLLCNKDVVASLRPCVTMDVSDSSGTIKAGAIAAVAEEILNCGATQLERYIAQGIKFDLDPVRAQFKDKMYLMCLRRSNSKRSDGQKRLLLVAYFNDTNPLKDNAQPTASNLTGSSTVDPTPDDTSPLLASPQNLDTVVSPKTTTGDSPTISPLKRQLEAVSIKTGSPLKKALFQASAESSSAAPPSTDKPEDSFPQT